MDARQRVDVCLKAVMAVLRMVVLVGVQVIACVVAIF
jgi:hypothetical protein